MVTFFLFCAGRDDGGTDVAQWFRRIGIQIRRDLGFDPLTGGVGGGGGGGWHVAQLFCLSLRVNFCTDLLVPDLTHLRV